MQASDRFNINSQLEHLQAGCSASYFLLGFVLFYGCSSASRVGSHQPFHRQAKHVGTGHADLSRFEWAVNIHRDRCRYTLGAASGCIAPLFFFLFRAFSHIFFSKLFPHCSYASYIGHHSLLSYLAVAENESIGRTKYNFMTKARLPTCLFLPRQFFVIASTSQRRRAPELSESPRCCCHAACRLSVMRTTRLRRRRIRRSSWISWATHVL